MHFQSFLLGFTFALLCFVLYYYSFILRPLNQIKKAIQRLLQAEYKGSIPPLPKGEVSDIAGGLNKLSTKLSKVEILRRDFVANVSHELKTPITSIKGFIEALLDGAKDDKKDLEKFLKIISKQVDRLSEIVEDLLTLARLEGEPQVDLIYAEDILLFDLLSSVKGFCKNQAEAKEVSVKIVCANDSRFILDRRLMEQALINLLDNAIKYSSVGGKVSLLAKVEEGNLRMQVEDSGLGIAKEHLPRIFERFYRVDKARSRELGGTGLGLAIVKHIVGIHGGRISVASELGQGTKFFIDINSRKLQS